MPDMKARDSWWAFINGRPEIEWNPPRKTKKQHQSWPKSTSKKAGEDYTSQFEVTYTEGDETITGSAKPVDEEEGQPAALVVSEFGEIAGEDGAEPDMDLERSELEIEVALGEDSGHLPTPFASPRPEIRYKAFDRTNHRGPGRPRTPTPALLRAMDSVSFMSFPYLLVVTLISLFLLK